MDAHGRRNHGWTGTGKLKRKPEPVVGAPDSEYGTRSLYPCKAGCGKLVPRYSFHHEECPNQD